MNRAAMRRHSLRWMAIKSPRVLKRNNGATKAPNMVKSHASARAKMTLGRNASARFLFAATTILYIDRSALGILAPELQRTIGWSEGQYGIINSVFMIAYAACFILMGKWIDLMGTRKGYLMSIGIWSVAALGHALARSWLGFAAARQDGFIGTDEASLVERLEILAADDQGRARLSMRLAAREGATGRAELVLAALGYDPYDVRVERVKLHFI